MLPNNNIPVFIFTIKVQEIFCNISVTKKTVVDGGDDRVMSSDYLFAVRLHQEPDFELVGHKWEIVDIQPREVIKLLV